MRGRRGWTCRAPHGQAGTWLLDPYDITISDNFSDSGTDETFTANTEGATIYSGTLTDALSNGAAVIVQTGTARSAAPRPAASTSSAPISTSPAPRRAA